jgi:hypothetical protein
MVAVFGAMKNIYTNYTAYLHPLKNSNENKGFNWVAP